MVVLSVEFTKNMTRSFGVFRVFRQRDDTWRPLFDMICSAKMIKLQNTEGIYQFGSTLWQACTLVWILSSKSFTFSTLLFSLLRLRFRFPIVYCGD